MKAIKAIYASLGLLLMSSGAAGMHFEVEKVNENSAGEKKWGALTKAQMEAATFDDIESLTDVVEKFLYAYKNGIEQSTKSDWASQSNLTFDVCVDEGELYIYLACHREEIVLKFCPGRKKFILLSGPVTFSKDAPMFEELDQVSVVVSARDGHYRYNSGDSFRAPLWLRNDMSVYDMLWNLAIYSGNMDAFPR
ncbi:MAG: hypothetical protein LBJ16_02085 [Holosporaceae bacterium]|nr:hypothetical protein [Holosporaceae bacterium]